MPRPVDAPRPAPALPRRVLLRAVGAAMLLPAAGCGAVALGGPEEYTPPPPGIDDLYREDLLALLEAAIAGTARVTEGTAGDDDPVRTAALAVLTEALPLQHRALLTGAEWEDEQEAGQEAEPSPDRTSSAPAVAPPSDLSGLLALLVELRDLAAAAARQVSGSLARPVVAIAAHTAWIAQRLHTAVGGALAPSPTADELVPTREVPDTDPPSIGHHDDYHRAIERAQLEEWYAGYLHEVLAARTEGEVRAQHLELTALHRERATALGTIAEEDGAPVVARQAVYAVPGGTLAEDSAAQLPAQLATGLMIDHVVLVGAAPFERRPLSIAAALQEAERLSAMVTEMEPLPSLEVEEPAPPEE